MTFQSVLHLFTCRPVGHYDKAKSAVLVETKNGSAKKAIFQAALQFFYLVSNTEQRKTKIQDFPVSFKTFPGVLIAQCLLFSLDILSFELLE